MYWLAGYYKNVLSLSRPHRACIIIRQLICIMDRASSHSDIDIVGTLRVRRDPFLHLARNLAISLLVNVDPKISSHLHPEERIC